MPIWLESIAAASKPVFSHKGTRKTVQGLMNVTFLCWYFSLKLRASLVWKTLDLYTLDSFFNCFLLYAGIHDVLSSLYCCCRLSHL
jgi:hypothetical protein